MPSQALKHEDYIPVVDVEKLRPLNSYAKMMDVRLIWGSNHLAYFSKETLQKALENTGFEVMHYETQGLDIEDIIWWCEHTQQYSADFLKSFRHQLQFCFNAGDWGKNLRLHGRKS